MIYPKIVRGGTAIPIGDNLFLMKGRKHKNGGIDVGKDLEVEGGEVMQTSPNEIKVFSAQKFLGGVSPSELILAGANPNQVFAAQEQYKDANKINDDGTKKKAKWGIFERWFGEKEDNTQTPVKGENSNNAETEQDVLDEYFKDVRSRQAYAESKYDINVKNSKDAYGLYQIRPIGVADYNRITGENIAHEDVLNPDTALKVRDVLMDSYWNRGWVNNSKNENDTVRMIKTLMAYNMGPGNALDTLNYMKANGVNIYNVEELLNNIPVNETKKYAKFVATGQSVGPTSYLNDSLYRLYKSRNIDLDNKIRTAKKYGGMSKKSKDAFMDSLIESINGLNKVKLNNTNSDNMSPIDLQILDRELNKDVLLGHTPSTGVQSKKCGGRAKAALGTTVIYKDGTKHNTNDDDYDESQIDENATDIYHGQKSLKTSHWLSTGLGALGRTAAGIIGASINNATNRKYIGQMEDLIKKIKTYNKPLTKLKTHVTIDPQLSEIDNALRIGTKDIDANTASSQVALARKRGLRLNSFLQKSKLYGYKENAENELINKERMLQTNEMREDIRDAQNIENQKLQMLAGLVDKRAENATATNQNIVGSIAGGVDTLLNGVNQYEQLLAGLAANPNGADAVYGQIGKTTSWRKKAYKKKDNEG